MKTSTCLPRSLVSFAVACPLVLSVACAGKQLDVGNDRTSGASSVECPVEKCENPFGDTSSDYDGVTYEPEPGGGPPVAWECTYYDGVKAPDGQWWSGDATFGWQLDDRLPGVVSRAGKKSSKTCVRHPYAGQGSMPADACGWKYLCERTVDPADACTSGTPARTAAPASLVGTWLLESYDLPRNNGVAGAMQHLTVAADKPILAVTFAADGTWRAASCGSADEIGVCSASCKRALQCASGTYAYAAGALDSTLASGAPHAVESTGKGITIKDFSKGLTWSNFVKIDALPPCE